MTSKRLTLIKYHLHVGIRLMLSPSHAKFDLLKATKSFRGEVCASMSNILLGWFVYASRDDNSTENLHGRVTKISGNFLFST